MADRGQEGNGRDRGWRKPLRSFAAWVENDDILTGFSKEESSAPEIRMFFVSTIGAALVAWDIAFNYGAFQTVFFARRHQIAVILFVVVLGTIVLRRQVKVNWWLLGLLSIPMLWIFFGLAVPPRENSLTSNIDSVLFVLVVMLYPVVFWIVLRLLAPEYFSIPNRRLKVMSVVIVIVIMFLGYAVGEQNSRFLSCNEFKVSGNDLPADCADGG